MDVTAGKWTGSPTYLQPLRNRVSGGMNFISSKTKLDVAAL
jgi:hypothetical protein